MKSQFSSRLAHGFEGLGTERSRLCLGCEPSVDKVPRRVFVDLFQSVVQLVQGWSRLSLALEYGFGRWVLDASVVRGLGLCVVWLMRVLEEGRMIRFGLFFSWCGWTIGFLVLC